MSRATTKSDLLKNAVEQFDKMWKLIDSIPDNDKMRTFDFVKLAKKESHWDRDKNLRDVLVHLYEWHQLLLNWVEININGINKPFLPEPYNWKTYGTLNVEFWQKHQSTSFYHAKEMLYISHKQVVEMIEKFTNDELFAKNQFKWTGTTTLGAYCVSATASHYDWAIRKIKTHINNF